MGVHGLQELWCLARAEELFLDGLERAHAVLQEEHGGECVETVSDGR